MDTEATGQAVPPAAEQTAQQVVYEYLLQHVEEFRDLHAERKKGWENDKADAHFKKQRKSADYADERTKKAFFDMMRKIATEMDKKTGALRFQSDEPIRVLDLCMAPGGYTAAMLDRYPNATSKAFTLPEERGGHQVRLDIQQRRRCEISYVDINMLAGDMGLKVEELPADHPDATQFKFEKLLADEDKFDIVFCDGQVLREHQRSEWREPKEAARLTLVQLAMGLSHVKDAGTMVILLHKVETFHNLWMLSLLDMMAEVQLFKPTCAHKTRSSYYLVAKKIDKGATAAQLVETWKRDWRVATLNKEEDRKWTGEPNADDAAVLMHTFGERAIDLGRGIWGTQAAALKCAKWNC